MYVCVRISDCSSTQLTASVRYTHSHHNNIKVREQQTTTTKRDIAPSKGKCEKAVVKRKQKKNKKIKNCNVLFDGRVVCERVFVPSSPFRRALFVF